MNQPADNTSGMKQPTLPPQLTHWQYCLLVGTWATCAIAIGYTIEELCMRKLNWSPCFVYLALALLPLGVALHLFVRRNLIAHRSRLADASVVDAIFAEVRSVGPRLAEDDSPGSVERPSPYKQKSDAVVQEMERLQDLGKDAWTEYEVLSLNQLLVEFLKTDDLITRAQSTLEDLEDYANEDAYGGYDRKHYGQWQERVHSAIGQITDLDTKGPDDKRPSAKERDDAAEGLRAVLTTLLEHVANYEANWAQGSSIYRSLSIFCLVAIPTLLTMGLLPLTYADNSGSGARLYFFHWAALGMAGAFAAVLHGFHRSDVVEIGNTDGKRELWRAVHGAVLGLVAGVLTFSTIAGGLISNGSMVPDVEGAALKDIGLAVIWAVGSGFFFERVFERLRSDGGSE